MTTPLASLAVPDAELVLGVVAALGTDLDLLENATADHLTQLEYRCESFRLSSFLETIDMEALGVRLQKSPEGRRLSTYMDGGNAVRRASERGDLLALFATSEIHQRRGEELATLPRTCHLLRSLKHPDEVRLLRKVYGPGFFLIAAYSPEEERLEYLTEVKGIEEKEARQLIERDQHEEDPFGQKTRDTFQLADVFVDLTAGDCKDQITRFLDLVFGAPHHTPTRHEHSMFLAHAAALRSADLSRQVGAVLTSPEGDIIATGANDVPKAGGGLHWPGPHDQRDHIQGYDSNERERDRIIVKAMRQIKGRLQGQSEATDEELLKEGKVAFAGSGLLSITEFGRAVHAEMEALLACARIGVSPRGGALYSTTYPCHNCAKHLIAAGIKEVFYIEPYPKSKAEELHSDAILIEGQKRDSEQGSKEAGKLRLKPFVGVGPRRYLDLFSMNLSSGDRIHRKKAGKAVEWHRQQATPRVPMSPMAYTERERSVLKEILQALEEEEP